MLNMEVKRLEEVEGAEVAIHEHLRKHKVQALIPEEVVLACDATGLSASGRGERVGYCFRIRRAMRRFRIFGCALSGATPDR
jgi:hypothetical protein